MGKYDDFISQNVAPVGSRRIGIYNSHGNRVGQIPLGGLTPPIESQRLYRFGALSDIHLQSNTATGDFERALRYFEEIGTDFICIDGDLTDNGTAAQLSQYKSYVTTYSPNVPVYAVFGNHDIMSGLTANVETYTGYPLYYTFERGNDLFVMVGIIGGYEGQLFQSGELEWLDTTLEANKNRRCFLFQHVLAAEGSGDVLDIYPHTKLRNNAESVAFKNILAKYPNVIFFHGHSHMMFSLQKYGANANYDHYFAGHSIHIPSLSIPREPSASGSGYVTYEQGSEGYVVDVYENGIHLRGRDFVKGEFLPIASYWLDTTV